MADNEETNGNHHPGTTSPIDEVSELLDVSGVPGSSEEEAGQELAPFEPEKVDSDFQKREQDYQEDYERARTSIHNQQQMIEELARITLESARLSNSPKFVEAFSQLMNRLTDVNEKMIRHQQYTRDALPQSKQGATGGEDGDTYNTQNNLTINMTMDELMSEVGTQYDAEDQREQQNRSGSGRERTPADGEQEDPPTQ